MTDFAPASAAEALLAARRDRNPIPIPVTGPRDEAEAYAVQDEVARGLGAPGAWKVGGGAAAPIAQGLVRPSPCRWPGGEFIRRGIEAEIAFRIGRDLATDGRMPSRDEIRAAIGSVHAAIEIADSRFDTWPSQAKLWALADNMSNGGFVHAPEGLPYDGRPLGRHQVTVTADGREVFAAEGVNAGGEPFELLVQLVGLSRTRGGVQAGCYVTTGSLCGIVFVEPSAAVVAEIAGFGRVEIDFGA
ncbi:2-keto-4-pentenoate hydratase [Enterovirga rhinocerotis]|uniref:2-keto-4-pentenoate hydratase n=1 Tax=Enterovirga rhinocerotis TaxID=1339210 RepID=A0A4R7BX21_9HYPH|nr:fumarylacetoacetate hydrolase family protein [Enterovirga rhinocerotis]TDR90498.1 2-keto-4-pentenoate hydratase [Enterovirga rhinocerotis]